MNIDGDRFWAPGLPAAYCISTIAPGFRYEQDEELYLAFMQAFEALELLSLLQ